VTIEKELAPTLQAFMGEQNGDDENSTDWIRLLAQEVIMFEDASEEKDELEDLVENIKENAMKADSYTALLAVMQEIALIPPTPELGAPIWSALSDLSKKLNADNKGQLNLTELETGSIEGALNA